MQTGIMKYSSNKPCDMLKQLKIKNYALIDDVDICFDKGFTAITGETGAGKSIILGALSLLLGSRADTSAQKDPSLKSIVEAVFDISKYKLADIFSSNEIDYHDEAILRREIGLQGKSRAFVNDTPANLSVLKLIGDKLIEIHSQNSNLEISDPDFQIGVLDSIASNGPLLAGYSSAFADYKRDKATLKLLEQQLYEIRKEADYRSHLLAELKTASLKDGEFAVLGDEYSFLTHLEEIKSSAQFALQALEADETGCIDNIARACKSLSDTSKFDTRIETFSARLESALIELRDIASEINKFDSEVDYSPEKVESIRLRLDTYNSLMLKHRCQTDAELIERMKDLEHASAKENEVEEQIFSLKASIQSKESGLYVSAEHISANRKKNIPVFGENIANLLRNLGMPNAEFDVKLERLEMLGASGIDKAEFIFAANKNATLRPVQETASGGEISRIMLCLKSILSKSKNLPTIVFDEIDIGISGDIAEKMGLIMRTMSDNMQVVAITHLPQIAGKGHNHFAVYKQDSDTSTSTNIRRLTDEDRITEIAKMLSGKELTQAALENAAHLLKS
jgi:DNA repair protein RecN (Recombination protein N)